MPYKLLSFKLGYPILWALRVVVYLYSTVCVYLINKDTDNEMNQKDQTNSQINKDCATFFSKKKHNSVSF